MNNKPLKILFDGNPMVNKPKSGIGYYTEQLVQALAQNYPVDIVLVGHYYNFLNRNKNPDLPKAKNIRYKPTYLVPGKLVNVLRRLGIEIPFELLVKSRGDFVLFPAYTSYPSLFGTPCSSIIYDMAFIDMPQTVSPRNLSDMLRWVPKSVKRSRFIITISEVMKQKLVSHFGLKDSGVIITPIPPQQVPVGTQPSRDSLAKIGITKPFILFVGNIEPRKNIVGLIKAYGLLSEQTRQKYSLVLAGAKGWNDAEILSQLETAKRDGLDIIVTGYVDDNQRNALYDSASMFAYVTFYEGFGMPLLESMAHNLPVLASDIPILHEVAGDAALYCDPKSPQDIANKMADLLGSTDLQKQFIAKGKDRLKLFSWDKVARTVYDAIRQSLSS